MPAFRLDSLHFLLQRSPLLSPALRPVLFGIAFGFFGLFWRGIEKKLLAAAASVRFIKKSCGTVPLHSQEILQGIPEFAGLDTRIAAHHSNGRCVEELKCTLGGGVGGVCAYIGNK